jgi:hypothetical protein
MIRNGWVKYGMVRQFRCGEVRQGGVQFRRGAARYVMAVGALCGEVVLGEMWRVSAVEVVLGENWSGEVC